MALARSLARHTSKAEVCMFSATRQMVKTESPPWWTESSPVMPDNKPWWSGASVANAMETRHLGHSEGCSELQRSHAFSGFTWLEYASISMHAFVGWLCCR